MLTFAKPSYVLRSLYKGMPVGLQAVAAGGDPELHASVDQVVQSVKSIVEYVAR